MTDFSYDFDGDGKITSDDVRLILSHVPTTNQVSGETPKEGIFTRGGGGANVYLDRLRS